MDDRTSADETREAAPQPVLFSLPGYRFGKMLGAGAMGRVYQARHTTTDREVAVKILPTRASDSQVERFKREARTAAALEHPNIVAIHDAGIASGMRYLVLEFVNGPTLATVFATKALGARSLARILAKVARGLAAAHEADLIHRDIKPGNILLDQQGEPHLADFGLATFLEDRGTLTRAGDVMGTPYYMAPEVVLNGASRAGRPSDVYSLGVVLREGLSGGVPFRADNLPAVFHRVASGDAEPIPADVPDSLRTVCEAAMAFEPNRRPIALRLAELLEEAADGLADEHEGRWCPPATRPDPRSVPTATGAVPDSCEPVPEPLVPPSSKDGEALVIPDPLSDTLEAELEVARQDPNRKFGQYLVLEHLASGGFGTVHRAWDVVGRRIVALKVLMRSDEESCRRFQHEAQAIASLRHPHIVGLLDQGVLHGAPFMAMEFIEGWTLGEHADETPMSNDAALRVIADASRAIQYAHDQGVLHRDLKPDNILVDGEGRARLLDFGLARVAETSRITQLGDMVGTPAYMAPEQADRGRGRETDERSDVYALGATLYHALTGRPPFVTDTTAELIASILTEEPPRPSLHNPEVTPQTEAVLLKCLAKDPDLRYASAGELATDLDRLLSGKPIYARPPSILSKAWSRIRRERLVAVLSLAVIVTTSLLIAQMIQGRQPPRVAKPAVPVPSAAPSPELSPGVELTPTPSAEASPSPTAEPTRSPSPGPSIEPTQAPSPLPSVEPTRAPTPTPALEQPASTPDAVGLASRKTVSLDGVLWSAFIALEVPEPSRALDRGFVTMWSGDDLNRRDRDVRRDPRNAQVLLNRGSARIARGDVRGALADYDRAIVTNSNLDKAWLQRGILHLLEGRLLKAGGDLDQALRLNKKKPVAWRSRAIVHFLQGDLEGAERDLAAAFERFRVPDARSYGLRGMLHEARGELEKAEDDYSKALQLDAGLVSVRLGLAQVYLRRGEAETALELFDQVVRDDRTLPGGWNGRGCGRILQGRFDLAVGDLQKARKLDESSAAIRSNLALLHLRKGEVVLAQGALRHALKLEGTPPVTYGLKGLVNALKGTWSARKDLRAFLAKVPKTHRGRPSIEQVLRQLDGR